MSDQPKPPSSESSSLNNIIEQVTPAVQKVWVSSRPTITQSLKGTIGLLQKAVDGLETQIQAEDNPVKPLDLTPVKTAANTFWTKTQPIWVKLVNLVRSRLPQDVSQKLNDRALSGVLAGVLLLLLIITTHLPGATATPKPVTRPIAAAPQQYTSPPATSKPVQKPIAQQFPIDTGKVAGTTIPSDLSAPKPSTTPTTIAKLPVANTVSAPTVTPQTLPSVSSEAPVVAKMPVQMPVQPPAPTPVKLTPQQKLLARIQENTPDYAKEIAQSVSPNKAQGKLKVTLATDWYKLTTEQQDQLSTSLFSQAQTLKFKSLELADIEDNLLARSPIVGNDMVVLLRQRG